MEQNKLPNNNEIDKEKKKLQQEVKRLDIYKNCNNYELDKFLCYFPNKATEIRECFCKEEGKNVLRPDKQEQLQKIIMDELCSLLYPCIKKGYQVKQLDGDSYNSSNQKYLICLNTPEDDKNIGISIGKSSKAVSTNAMFYYEYNNTGQSKLKFHPDSGIQINHNYKDNNFHNEIKIYNKSMSYILIIYPDTKDIKLTDFNYEDFEYANFCDKNDEIFKNKEDIIYFFSTLSFTEIEQVLQILNKHLENKKYDEVDIKKVLEEIKNTIEENREEEKKNEESSIGNNINNSNNLIPNNSNNLIPNNSNNNSNNLSLSGNDLNKALNQKNTFVKDNNINNDKGNESNIIKKELINEESNEINKNENKNSNDDITKTKLKIEEEDKTSCNCCITCLKQCWPFSEKEK